MTGKKVVLFRKNRHSERCFTNPIIVNTVTSRVGGEKEGIKMLEQGNKELAYPMDTTKNIYMGSSCHCRQTGAKQNDSSIAKPIKEDPRVTR